MKLLEKMQELGEIGKSRRDKQAEINVSEAWHLWDLLVARYDVIETTNLLYNFADDKDLQLILKQGLGQLKKQSRVLEQLMEEYGIPLPMQPPESANNANTVEVVTDRYVYRRIFAGIQGFLPIHMSAFIQSTSPKIREKFKSFIIEEMDIYDMFFEYGKMKGYTFDTPAYRQ